MQDGKMTKNRSRPDSVDQKPHQINPDSNHILILGDWVVDEYWLLVRHHSDISSHIGFTHFRSSPASLAPGKVLMDLCGAGHVARIFHKVDSELPDCQIWGLGVWHPDDEAFLHYLLQKRGVSQIPKAFFRGGLARNETPRVTLVNLDPERGQTTQVVRLYHSIGTGIEQLSRIDWESPHYEAYPLPVNLLKKSLNGVKIGAIVVHDLRKGVITPDLVAFLRGRYPGASWYVRSKDLNPVWLDTISPALRLLLLGPEILQSRNPWGSWLIENKITFQAKELLDQMPKTSVVLLLDSREVIALAERDSYITARGVGEVDPFSQVGWSSAFFAALIFKLLKEGAPVTKGALEHAMSTANDHIKDVMGPGSAPPPTYPVTPPDTTWAEEDRRWCEARTGKGIIRIHDRCEDVPEPEYCLEVWRGCTALPGYVACIPEKREIINDIGRHLRSFSGMGSRAKSVSIMLQADPGTGKTFLAKSLAKAFEFSLVKADITQMVHREDLLDLFDSVATEQANQGKPVLVFVDEVNALLDGSNVYGAFLAPLEEGAYVRRGKAFNLQPCAWIFAGTGLDGVSGKPGDKVEDFKARMTMIAQFDFQSLLEKRKKNVSLSDDARLEQVYLGACMIKQLYPDVDLVSYGVLDRFYNLNPAQAPARTIRKLIMLLRNVQYGKITERNCKAWEYPPESETPLVRLVFGGLK